MGQIQPMPGGDNYPYRQQQAPMPGQPGFYPPEDVEQGKMWALLGYIIGPLWIIPLVQRDNAFALYHAKQAMVYTIVTLVIVFPISMITCGLGSFLIFPLMYPWIMGIINSAGGKYEPLPWMGQYADRWFPNLVADKRPGGGGYIQPQLPSQVAATPYAQYPQQPQAPGQQPPPGQGQPPLG